MRGLEESKAYFLAFGRDWFEARLPELFPRLAFGLAGHGSECFGFDDDLSRDHDFTCGFAVWLSDEDEERYGFEVMRAYSSLLREHAPGDAGKSSKLGESEHGVRRIRDFYLRHIGLPSAPESWQQWLYTPEHAFAEAVNGEVFLDGPGTFSAIRKEIAEGMPEDVRLKKIASRVVTMAQSGQYNFSRCHRHGEHGAAALALGQFVTACSSLVFLFNRRFCPYYKWMLRAMKTLPRLGELASPLEFLLCDPASPDEKAAMISDICAQIAAELARQELSDAKDDYLEAHAFEIMKKIRSPHIRALHVMEG